MTRILRRLRDESGIALVIALMSLVVLGIAVTSVISYTTTNQRSSNASRGRTSAFSLAEAGV
jgi:Tfp pilus assembly protein PilX